MKQRRLVVFTAVAVVLTATLGLLLLRDEPRRPRPAGWRQPWDALPLEREGEWTLDSLKRGVVQASYFSATDQLTRCMVDHGGPEGVVKLELLVETEAGGTHLEYVDAELRPDLPEDLMPCITRVLEQGMPVPTPRLAEGTRWRLEVNFLVHPRSDFENPPWWRRLLPASSPGKPPIG